MKEEESTSEIGDMTSIVTQYENLEKQARLQERFKTLTSKQAQKDRNYNFLQRHKNANSLFQTITTKQNEDTSMTSIDKSSHLGGTIYSEFRN